MGSQRKLMYISDDFYAEHEPDDYIKLGGLGIGADPSATGINLGSGNLTITGTSGVDISGSTGVITGLPTTPAGSSDAASKAYVDSISGGVSWRDSVQTVNLVDDSLSTPPGSPVKGNSYLTDGQSAGPYNITGVNITSETFTLAGDHSSLDVGDIITVAGSTGNNGEWTVVSTSGTGPTVITVSEDVTDDTVDGTIDYCDPGSAWDTIGINHLVVYNGSSWDDIHAISNEDRVVVIDTSAAGGLASQENDIATFVAATRTWTFENPDDGWAVLVDYDEPTHYWGGIGFTYDASTTDWHQFTGLGQVNAGTGLSKDGNTINAGAGNGISVAADTIAAAGEALAGVSVGASGIAVTPHTATDGSGVTLADADEILIADADDTWDTKRVAMSQIQDYISTAGLDYDLTDGSGIADFTYNGGAAATVAVEASDNSIDVAAGGISVGFGTTVPGLETADGGVRIATGAAGNALTGGGGAALAVDVTGGTDGTSLDLQNTDEFLFADASDTNATKKTTLAKIQDAIAAENADLTDGNGILDFTYDGGSAASVAVSVTDTTDGSAVDLLTGDEFLFADVSDSNATKKTTLAKIQAGVAALNSDLTDGNGISDFTYDGSSPASITVQTVSTDRITVAAGGIDVAGVPSTFKIAGNAVSSNVTQANVDILVDGVASVAEFHDASALHAHKSIWSLHEAGTAGVTANSAVRVSADGEVVDGESDSDAGARIVGVALDTAADGVNTRVVSHGIATVLSGATPGAPYYVQADGTLANTMPTAGQRRIIRMGYALSATELMVHIVDLGKRAAA